MPKTTDSEIARLQELDSYNILDTPPEADFDRLTRLASRICDTPIALVSLIDAERQWFKSAIGLDVRETQCTIAFCSYTIEGRELFIVNDASEHAWFSENPLVTGDPYIRFYAGVPLVSPRGHALGTLCVIDLKPRILSEEQMDALQTLSAQVMAQLELRRQNKVLIDLVAERDKMNLELSKQAIHLNEAQRIAHIGSWQLQIADNSLSWSDEIYRIFGILREDFAESFDAFMSFVHPDDRQKMLDANQATLHGQGAMNLIHRIVLRNGSIRHVHELGELIYDKLGRPIALAGTVQDVTDWQQMESFRHEQAHIMEQIAADEELTVILNAIVQLVETQYPAALCSILLMDESEQHLMTGASIKLPGSYMQILDGVRIGEKVGSCGTAAFHRSTVIVEDIASDPLWDDYRELALSYGLRACWSIPIISANDHVLGTFAVYAETPYRPSDEELELVSSCSHIVGIAIDRHNSRSTSKAAEEEIRQLAFYDHLTSLPNRRLLLDRLKQVLAHSLRFRSQAALLFIDLDNFKALNDTLGHAQGDELLKTVATRLLICVRDFDTVARLGGDEFVVLITELSSDLERAAKVARDVSERILKSLNQPYILLGREHNSTPSIGITLIGDYDQTPDDLLTKADLAMYQAKAAGRNNICFFDPHMQTSITTRVQLETDLYNGLQASEFTLHYQPQVNQRGEVIGAEALLRWHHGQRGMISPLEFIPVAEEIGFISLLGHWVLETACNQIKLWSESALTASLSVAVNVSARQFHQQDFVQQVTAVLDYTGANPQRLKLELTETMLVKDMEDIIGKMSALRAIGVSFALDDFGTGFSSLNYLKRLPLDQLKIDQTFIRDIFKDNNDQVIVRSIVALGNSLGLNVIAEGVETQEQRDFLAQNGCRNYQGYLFSRPMPIADFERFIKSVAP